MVWTGRNTRHVALSPDGKEAYVSNTGSATIAVIDAHTGRKKKIIRVGSWPKTIDVTSDGKYLFSANYQGRSMSIVDLTKRKEIKRIRFKDRLSGLDIAPDDSYVLVTGWDKGQVWRFKITR